MAGYVAAMVYEALNEFFGENPKDVRLIIEKVIDAAQAGRGPSGAGTGSAQGRFVRQRPARQAGGLLGARTRPSEVFIVEGDSTRLRLGKQGRNPSFRPFCPFAARF